MTAAQIIDEITAMDAGDQDEIIRFTATLAAKRRLSGPELSELAAQLPDLAGPKAEDLKRQLERGFYGTASNA